MNIKNAITIHDLLPDECKSILAKNKPETQNDMLMLTELLAVSHLPKIYPQKEREKQPDVVVRSRPGKLKLHNRPLDDRIQDADRLNGILLFAEVAICGEYRRFMHHAMKAARGSKLYRQGLKRTLNELQRVVDNMASRCRITDHHVLMKHVVDVMPAYRTAYINEGGGSVDRLQGNWMRLGIGGTIDRLHEQLVTLCRLASLPCEELTAPLYVLNALAKTAIECYEVIARQQNELLAGDIIVHRQESGHNRRIHSLTMQALSLLTGGDAECISRYGMASSQVRGTIEELHRKLSGREFCEVCNTSLMAASMEYTEYAMAHLRVDLERGTVPAEVRGQIACRLKDGATGADLLMEELREVPMPAPADEVDIWEFASQMPPGRRGGALHRFRRWTVERIDLPDYEE